jgi:DNA-binding NarL/FixJ family response regulator
MSPPCRVVVADDHPFYRKGLVTSLHESGIDVVREVANGEAAIRAVAETAPDLVLMDVNMPGLNGVEATPQLTGLFPMTRVLMLSVSAEEADVLNAIEAGATGYLLKESPPDEVITAIREAAAGRPVVSARLAAMLSQPIRGLSKRDFGTGRLAPS